MIPHSDRFIVIEDGEPDLFRRGTATATSPNGTDYRYAPDGSTCVMVHPPNHKSVLFDAESFEEISRGIGGAKAFYVGNENVFIFDNNQKVENWDLSNGSSTSLTVPLFGGDFGLSPDAKNLWWVNARNRLLVAELAVLQTVPKTSMIAAIAVGRKNIAVERRTSDEMIFELFIEEEEWRGVEFALGFQQYRRAFHCSDDAVFIQTHNEFLKLSEGRPVVRLPSRRTYFEDDLILSATETSLRRHDRDGSVVSEVEIGVEIDDFASTRFAFTRNNGLYDFLEMRSVGTRPVSVSGESAWYLTAKKETIWKDLAARAEIGRTNLQGYKFTATRDGKRALLLASDQNLYVWDRGSEPEIWFELDYANHFAFSPDFLLVRNNRSLHVFDLAQNSLGLFELGYEPTRIEMFGNRFAVSDRTGNFDVFEVALD